MKSRIKALAILIAFAAAICNLTAQTATDSLIFRAMQDEIDRSMGELEYRDYDKPCFMGFELMDTRTVYIGADIGGLMTDSDISDRSWSFRLIVGSYDLNDENFSGQNREQNGGFGNSLSIFPLENDYYGIRRAYWLRADEIYRRAGANHKEKLNLIEKGVISNEDLSLPDFTRAEPVELFIPPTRQDIDKELIRNRVKELSELYGSMPGVDLSSAHALFLQNDVRYLNSEGTRVSIPCDLAMLRVTLTVTDREKKDLDATFTAYRQSASSLPAPSDIMPVLQRMAGDLVSYSEAGKLEKEYNGPVLFIGQPACKFMLRNLFSYSHSLVAERNNLVVDEGGDVYFENVSNDWQEQTGNRILPSGTQVTALPHTGEYEGKDLIGAFPVDSEGIIPPDTIIMVRNGVLEKMLSARTPTSSTDVSNGHARHYFTSAGLSHYTGPGVIKVDATGGLPEEYLKELLIEKAKEEGLSHAMIIRSMSTDAGVVPDYLFTVDVETGEEKMVRKASYNDIVDKNELKELRFADTGMVYQTLYPVNSFSMGGFNSYSAMVEGIPVSYLGPSAVLAGDMEISAVKEISKLHVAGDAITNPLDIKE